MSMMWYFIFNSAGEWSFFFFLKMEIDKILAASKLCPLATTSSPKFVNFLFTVESPHKRRHSIHFIHELFCYPLKIYQVIGSFWLFYYKSIVSEILDLSLSNLAAKPPKAKKSHYLWAEINYHWFQAFQKFLFV